MPRHMAVWVDGDDRALAGRVSLTEAGLLLEGSAPGRESLRRVPYRSIRGLRLGRANGERVGGRTALVVGLGAGDGRLRIAALQPGALSELTDELAVRTNERSDEMKRVVIATDGSADATWAVHEG